MLVCVFLTFLFFSWGGPFPRRGGGPVKPTWPTFSADPIWQLAWYDYDENYHGGDGGKDDGGDGGKDDGGEDDSGKDDGGEDDGSRDYGGEDDNGKDDGGEDDGDDYGNVQYPW